MPKILIDADGCPVVEETIELASAYHVEVMIVCDTSHYYAFEDVKVIMADKGRDASDFLLLRNVEKNDIIITQDYGLAALALSKHAIVLSQNGFHYTEENIDSYLQQRHTSSKMRKQGHHTPIKKRSAEDDERFIECLQQTLDDMEI